MSDSIENLLVRNLHEVFGERDPARRATAIEAIFDRDCLFSDPRGQHVGHRALDDAIVTSRHSSRTTCFRPTGRLDEQPAQDQVERHRACLVPQGAIAACRDRPV